jgi:hypothetical protein
LGKGNGARRFSWSGATGYFQGGGLADRCVMAYLSRSFQAPVASVTTENRVAPR